MIQIVGVQSINFLDAGGLQIMQQRFGDLIIGVGDDFAAILVHDVAGNHATDQEFFGYIQLVDTSFLHFADMAHSDALVLGHDDLAGFAQNIKTCHISAQTLRHHLKLYALFAQMERVKLEEHLEHVLVAVTQRAQQDGDRHLAPAVDTEVYIVLDRKSTRLNSSHANISY